MKKKTKHAHNTDIYGTVFNECFYNFDVAVPRCAINGRPSVVSCGIDGGVCAFFCLVFVFVCIFATKKKKRQTKQNKTNISDKVTRRTDKLVRFFLYVKTERTLERK